MLELIIVIVIMYLLIKQNIIENWRDLPFIGNKDTNTYHRQDVNVSRKNLPIYYPISSPLDEDYFSYVNSLSSPKLSLFRSLLRKVEIYTNQGAQPIIYNFSERPVTIKKIDKKQIKKLADSVIGLINKYGKSVLKVELVKTLNEIQEETDIQTKINFDMKIKLYYPANTKPDILYIQPEFIFEKTYNKLPEDQFFAPKQDPTEFKAFLSKLIIVGSENLGFLAGRYDNNVGNRQPRGIGGQHSLRK